MIQPIYTTAYVALVLKSHAFKPGFRSKGMTFKRSTILFITGGSGTILVNRIPYSLHAGSFVLLSPSDYVQIHVVETHDELKLQLLHYQRVRLSIRHQSAEAIPEHTRLETNQKPVVYSSPALLDTMLGKLKNAMLNSDEESQIKQQLSFYELMAHLHSHMETYHQQKRDSIQQTIVYMEENYAKPIPLKQLPLIANMTPSSYCRAFKKQTGITPGHFLTRIRLLHAKELMMDRNTTLRDIASHVGYQDELYFSRVFKRFEGMSPSAYMQRKDKRIAVVSRYLLQDHLLALGIVPIAAPAYPNYYHTPSGFPSYLHDRLQDTVPLHAERTITSQALVRLHPDLVFKTEFLHKSAEPLPKLEGNILRINPSTSWEQYLRDIAKRLDKEQAAERIIQKMTHLESEAQRLLAPIANTGNWAVIRLWNGDCRLYGIEDHTFTELFYHRLKFQADPRMAHSYYLSNALEYVLHLNPDHILLIWSEPEAIEAIQQDQRWHKLNAVIHNQVHIPDSREWDPWGPIGREVMIQTMLKYFSKKMNTIITANY